MRSNKPTCTNGQDPVHPREDCFEPGLSKREYFAAAALIGLLSNAVVTTRVGESLKDGDAVRALIARASVMAADAILLALDEAKP